MDDEATLEALERGERLEFDWVDQVEVKRFQRVKAAAESAGYTIEVAMSEDQMLVVFWINLEART